MINLDLHDVLVFRHRPIGAVGACRAVMNRVLAPQPGEIRLPDIVLVEMRVADVDRVERQALGIGNARRIERCGHRFSSRLSVSGLSVSGLYLFSVGLPAGGRQARRAPRSPRSDRTAANWAAPAL